MHLLKGLLSILALSAPGLQASVVTNTSSCIGSGCNTIHHDSIVSSILFKIGKSAIETSYDINSASLNSIIQGIDLYSSDGRDYSVDIIGMASPDGRIARNIQLARERSEAARDVIISLSGKPNIRFNLRNGGIDWPGLKSALETSPAFAGSKEVLEILSDIQTDGTLTEKSVLRIKKLNGGKVWEFLCRNFFPDLRRALVTVYSPPRNRATPVMVSILEDSDSIGKLPAASDKRTDTIPSIANALTPENHNDTNDLVSETANPSIHKKTRHRGLPFCASISTNILYDIILIPNIGIDIYLGNNWSVNINGMYGWWDNNHRHRYWRAYGCDMGIRHWIVSASGRKPLTGHHIGVYAQMLTYDIEFGGKGQMAGKPGGNFWDNPLFGAGVEYGYSIPMWRRLSIDFSIGIGYLGGKYYEYKPIDGHYVWLNTKKRNWVGPTKAQISLVWLLGNNKKSK